MKLAANIAGALLGLLFVVFGSNFFLNFIPMPPPPPEGTPMAMFGGAMFATGYMAFVKILEIAGGLLVAIPRTRAIGLLILAPIVVNIIAFHAFIMAGEGLVNPVLGLIVALLLFLIWQHRKGLAALASE